MLFNSDASHPPKHVEFRDPICTVMGEEDIVISKNNYISGTYPLMTKHMQSLK